MGVGGCEGVAVVGVGMGGCWWGCRWVCVGGLCGCGCLAQLFSVRSP